MTFENYLLSKKIDATQFNRQQPERFIEWKKEFEQMHPESFTVGKKFLINEIRRKFLLQAPSGNQPAQ